MADIFDTSKLLCDEETSDLCFFDDDDADNVGTIIDYDDSGAEENPLENRDQDPIFNDNENGLSLSLSESSLLIQIPVQSDEVFSTMIEKENEYLPHDDYVRRLRNGEMELIIRKEAFDWISKAHAHYNYGPLTLCLSINYLDRFLSVCGVQRDRDWAVQLLAVACLSVAVKMEETDNLPTIGLQVGKPRFLFEANSIQRMELILLSTLNWKTSSLTPCSFIDYFLNKIIHDHQYMIPDVINKSIPLILSTIRGIEFLEFKASEIAAAVAISVVLSSGDEARHILSVNVDDAIAALNFLNKDRVVKCMELIKDLRMKTSSSETINIENNNATTMSAPGSGGGGPGLSYSPIGILDTTEASCLTYKSGDYFLILGQPRAQNSPSCSTTSSISAANSPQPKRMKMDNTQPPPPAAPRSE